MEWMNEKGKNRALMLQEIGSSWNKFPIEIFSLAFGRLPRSVIGNICASVSSPLKLIGVCSGHCLSVYGRSSLSIFGAVTTWHFPVHHHWDPRNRRASESLSVLLECPCLLFLCSGIPSQAEIWSWPCQEEPGTRGSKTVELNTNWMIPASSPNQRDLLCF